MKNFHTQKLVEIWQKAVGLYQSGHQKSVDFPLDDDLPFLQELGMNKMDIFDFAEDWLCEGETGSRHFSPYSRTTEGLIFGKYKTGSARPSGLIPPLCHRKILKLKESGGFHELFPRQKLS